MNANLLKYHAAERSKSAQDMAAVLGISKRSVEKKIKGETDFKCKEIKQLIELLGLSADDTMRVFFS